MSCAKFLQAIPKRIDSGLGRADNHAEETLLEEALRRERQAVLFLKKLFAEVDIVGDSLEFIEVNANHHVHGSAASNWSYTSDGGQAGEGSLRRG